MKRKLLIWNIDQEKILRPIYGEQNMENAEKRIIGIWDIGLKHIIGVPEQEKKENGAEEIFEEIMAKIFQNQQMTSATSSRSATNLRQDKCKGNHTKEIYSTAD